MSLGIYVTRDDVVEYVKARLGHPVLELELELAEKDGLGHVHLAINDSLDWMYRHNQDEANFHDWMIILLRQGIIEYDVPEEVTDVIDAAPSFGNGFTPWTAFDVGAMESLVATTGWSQFDLVTYTAAMRYIADVKKLVGIQYQVRFHPQQHRLRIFPTPRNDRVAICKVYRKAAISEIFANILFRDLVTARTKIIWGEILDRDDYTLPGGGKVNGSRLLTDARSDLKDVEQRILDESARPFILTDLDM
jgi:hypothetical protein